MDLMVSSDATVSISVGPFEGFGTFVVGFDIASDFAGEVGFGSKDAAGDQIALNFGEPDFDLIEPGGPGRREMEMDVRVTLEPAVVLGLVGVEIVENDMEFAARMLGDDAVHEVEEFDAAPALVLPSADLAGRHVEGRKQSRNA